MPDSFKVIHCTKCNFSHLYPKPSKSFLKKYYEKEYYQKLKQPILDFKKELRDKSWLDQQSKDHIAILKKFNLTTGKILDIGCGNGLFLNYMKNSGWEVLGIEPSDSARKNAKSLNVPTQATLRGIKKASFDVIMLRYTLEHLLDPLKFLKKTKSFLDKNGILIIVVPNDYNSLQICATKIGFNEWWVRTPDHINYFNFKSLRQLLEQLQLDVVYETTDFPMELFLLMGENYVNNPNMGKRCHNKRMNFEKNIDPIIRRKLYSYFAKNGLGRSCIVYAKNH